MRFAGLRLVSVVVVMLLAVVTGGPVSAAGTVDDVVRQVHDAAGDAMAARRDATDAHRGWVAAADRVAALSAQQREVAAALAAAQAEVDVLAAVAYVGWDPVEPARALAGPSAAVSMERRVYVGVIGGVRADLVDELLRIRGQLDRDTEDALAESAGAERRYRGAFAAVEAADARLVEMQERLVETQQAVAADTAARILADPSGTWGDTNIPLVALDAYQRAAHYARTVFPGCHLDWYEIAGIGRVESNHGRFGEATVYANGDIAPPIRGIALDGTRSARIYDTDGGVLDGDPVWDRAVGPMQFIPATWRGYERSFDLDGNGDGQVSPDNMYDAARAAGLYLCRSGGSMTSDADRRRAAFAYNRSQSYVATVLGWMRAYSLLDVPDLTGNPIPAAVSSEEEPVLDAGPPATPTGPPVVENAGPPESGAAPPLAPPLLPTPTTTVERGPSTSGSAADGPETGPAEPSTTSTTGSTTVADDGGGTAAGRPAGRDPSAR